MLYIGNKQNIAVQLYFKIGGIKEIAPFLKMNKADNNSHMECVFTKQ